MSNHQVIDYNIAVALRKESVDRNILRKITITVDEGSLSARRAWIEMPDNTHRRGLFQVALRKESVDRNATALLVYLALIRRSPQGERG